MAHMHHDAGGGGPIFEYASRLEKLHLRGEATSREGFEAVGNSCHRGVQDTQKGPCNDMDHSTLDVQEEIGVQTPSPSLCLSEMLSRYGLPSSSSSTEKTAASSSERMTPGPWVTDGTKPQSRRQISSPIAPQANGVLVYRSSAIESAPVLRFSSPQHALDALNEMCGRSS
eukprot:TRINITY_DN14740_c1_g3_i2.p1 TRINITY_DN14740_c1_g3~~TRINITY_DN14740_c1_g3_i2.p1  ORF type:complete len:181 (-),score=19.98 TRINITY_DN14740_c1_g3_i2:370-882(-)